MTNYQVIKNPNDVPIKAWVNGVPFAENAKEQLLHLAKMPFVYKWLAVMPDVHLGIGSTVGSVIATRKAIIPASVGVDIGCGMMAVQTSLRASDLPDNLFGIRSAIEASVPHGRTDNGGANDKGAWRSEKIPSATSDAWLLMLNDYLLILERHPALNRGSTFQQLGTLGTGNHFIELCLDENDNVWIMLHSGSRGVGGRIGSHFIALAKSEMERWHISLPNQDLAYLPEGSEYFGDYWRAVKWAQLYASTNRNLMLNQIIQALKGCGLRPFEYNLKAINCHHNYVDIENHYGENVFVTRKGAVCARKDTLGIIPGSMGTRSYIVRGKGNPESFHSCSHGAGRVMSRTEASKTFTVEDHIKATEGIECRKDADVIDETPGAYKSIDAVMDAQKDLVDIVHTLRQVVCVKG